MYLCSDSYPISGKQLILSLNTKLNHLLISGRREKTLIATLFSNTAYQLEVSNYDQDKGR